MYRRLEGDQILSTAQRLERRIAERFPRAGLRGVSRELVEVAGTGRERLQRLSKPMWWLRAGAVIATLALLAAAFGAVMIPIRMSREVGSQADILQAIQSLLDEVILLGVAIYFLTSLESRFKRSNALGGLHELRSLALVIDMHQLTKDPERVLYPELATTDSSPSRDLSRFELGRYLDYCSEMLSITSKLAALHVQDVKDPVVLGAVRDVESLASSLSAKIWQKKMILDFSGTGLRP